MLTGKFKKKTTEEEDSQSNHFRVIFLIAIFTMGIMDYQVEVEIDQGPEYRYTVIQISIPETYTNTTTNDERQYRQNR